MIFKWKIPAVYARILLLYREYSRRPYVCGGDGSPIKILGDDIGGSSSIILVPNFEHVEDAPIVDRDNFSGFASF
jgi:hypothetical protein